ncbi:hypothetical protein PLANPX_5189 [Lacipirellula parvula]|uniref:Tetratricopeptide repeat protein n=2 Tax=Lacipirellula parvula TaxID=2650471 RepID=A0A5K7XHW9_9BACT|nr:hypothetical protein PLANPX_5189 [Lacipirellula parvula]
MAGREFSRLEECYARGSQLAHRERNYPYAHELFTQCVIAAPGNPQYADAFLQNLRRLFPRKQSPAWQAIAKRRNVPLKKKLAAGEWEDAMRLGIDLLRQDPWNVDVLRAMATSCEHLHCNESELVYLKQALNSAPRNVEVNRHCALSLARMGQFDQAIACWHRIESIAPRNREAAEMISRLCQERLRYPDGKPSVADAASRGSAPCAEEAAQAMEMAPVVLSPIETLERAIAQAPNASENYLRLAELHVERGRYLDAQSVLYRGISNCGEVAKLDELLELVGKRLKEQEIERQALEAMRIHANDIALPAIPWLELTLTGAIGLLILQFLPDVGTRILAAVNVAQWSRGTWAMANFYALFGLLLVRYRVELTSLWRER